MGLQITHGSDQLQPRACRDAKLSRRSYRYAAGSSFGLSRLSPARALNQEHGTIGGSAGPANRLRSAGTFPERNTPGGALEEARSALPIDVSAGLFSSRTRIVAWKKTLATVQSVDSRRAFGLNKRIR